ncbi:MAG TPA: uroporphyrinogen-III C-methyltransferase [Pseudomonadota bacterium]|nr:uroporphyrinogen-III C-methyltransferase [Rhodanobacteraceae bacterium]MBP9154431.1 uroporphyrinogen-III C-methyltransferase [Xanthomonadales bacterium]HQW81544.1 uroporphyrinogen-III C-methyltransferase [Pseudomonadota bacterium]
MDGEDTRMNEVNSEHPARGGRGALMLALAALAIAITTAIAVWYVADATDRSLQEREATSRRVALAEEENGQLRRQISALTRRFDDDDALDRSLREELLGISERAALLEQAIKRVSENRMDSVSELRLNQAELLLSAGIERLGLFHDAVAAATALRLADSELARLEDPRYAGVRQTLAQEIAELDAVPKQAYGETLALLTELRVRLPQLPLRGASSLVTPAPAMGRFETLLRGLVRVRRVSPREAGMLGPLAADTLRAVVALDLLHAEEALRQQDATRYQALVGQARNTLAFGFDLDAASSGDVRQKLARVAAYKPVPWPMPGAALEQLVNLRHTRDVAHGIER